MEVGEVGRKRVPEDISGIQYVTDKDLYLRQGAMEGLAGIGEEGLPHILKALKYWNKADGNGQILNNNAGFLEVER